MGEDNERKPGQLRIVARRPAAPVILGTEPLGARIISTRLIDPADYPRLRQERFEATRSALLTGSRDLPLGVTRSLNILPEVQRAENTCMLACAISLAKGVARRNGKIWVLDEKTIANEAREKGLLLDAGMATAIPEDRLRSLEFLHDRLGLSVRPIDTIEGTVKAHAIVQSLIHGNCALINSGAHWVTVFGLDKQATEQISWLGMDPLKPEIQRYSTDDLANRLLGSLLLGPERLSGVSGEVYTIDTQVHGVRILESRPPG